MYSGAYLPFRPKKGEAFRLYFGNTKSNGEAPTSDETPTSAFGYRISKDGAASVATTNVPTFIGTGNGGLDRAIMYLDLTASEMDADEIVIFVRPGAGSGGNDGVAKHFVIYTDGYTGFEDIGGGSGGGSLSLSVGALSAITEGASKSYFLTQMSLDDGGFNYFASVRAGRNWFIIRETTDQSETKFFQSPIARQSFNDGWANRASLTYGDDLEISCN